ncbi:uncharacterized protein LOC129615915 [Condylostylus longicornis]|uniref:uncharacterized protein LOC129615915 n=1 Tax=Condylostylus longicornis TaxID=2530218 RepID=UPI00244E4254|nr:uncharacterized protein LOC129615915 [Condylostylus longicornis]
MYLNMNKKFKYEIFLKIMLIIGGFSIKLVSSNFTCYECDKDIDCTTLENPIKNVVCDAKKCFTISLGINKHKRGCISTLTEFETTVCTNDTPHCHICDKSNCNNKILPENRPLCYQCNDELCMDVTKLIPKYCLNYTENKCFTYFDGINMIRDCVDEKKNVYDLCKQYDIYCNICNGNNIEACNNHTMELKCLNCDSDKGNCKYPDEYPNNVDPNNCLITEVESKSCMPKIVNNSLKLCYTYIDRNNYVKRGCYSDLDIKNINGQLTTCQKNKCNNNCIKDISCIQCDSEVNNDCGRITSDIDPEWKKNCPDSYNSVCHRCEDTNGRTIRGCGKSLMSNCNYCFDNYCMAKPTYRKCYKCDEKDLNCVNGGSYNDLEIGECYNTKSCFVGITKDGFTRRNCLPKDEDWKKEYLEYKICNDSNLCNIHVIPTDRTLCFQCNSKNDPWCKEPKINEDMAKPCNIYKTNEQCYLYADKDENMIRGCQSDDSNTNENRKGCNNPNNNCIKCKGSRCNLTPFKRTSLKCMKCDETDIKCSTGFDKNEALECELTPYYSNQTCFIHIDGNRVNRGCTLDSNNKKFNCEDKNNKKCQVCIGDGCNYDKINRQKCIRCRSDATPICAKEDISELEPELCKDEIRGDNVGCYTEKFNGIVFRACVSELTENEINECKKSKSCNICQGSGCNNKKAPNSASNLYFSSFLLFITIGFISRII